MCFYDDFMLKHEHNQNTALKAGYISRKYTYSYSLSTHQFNWSLQYSAFQISESNFEFIFDSGFCESGEG